MPISQREEHLHPQGASFVPQIPPHTIGDLMPMDIPLGRRLMGQGGGDPKWVAMRMGPLTARAPVRVSDASDHHKHLGYVAILGIAAGILALVCFYFCVWLVRQRQCRHWGLRPVSAASVEGGRHTETDEKVRKSGEGEGEKPTWNVDEVELVLMAGENVPTFLAHPVEQCSPLHLATPTV